MAQVQTYTAAVLNAAGNRKRYDAICKKILSSKEILSYLFHELIPEYANSSKEDIKNRYIESGLSAQLIPAGPNLISTKEYIEGSKSENSLLNEATVKFDVVFSAMLPDTLGTKVKIIVDFEAQGNYRPGYPIVSRGIYYGCRLISSQLEDLTQGTNYASLQKVYSIWICLGERIPKKEQFTISTYSLKSESIFGFVPELKQDFDLVTVILIRLGQGHAKSGIFRMLQALFSPVMPMEERRRILTEEFDIKLEKEINQEVMELCTLSQAVVDYGIKQGIEQGIGKGIDRGVDICEMLIQTQSVRETSKNMDIPLKKVRIIAKRLGLKWKD